MMITLIPKKGDLLIAEPTIIGDVSFNRSIILLADHTDEGSIGFIINKPLEYTINDLVPSIKANFKVFYGGPVEQDNLYFIHTIPHLIPNSTEISLGVYWGGEFSNLSELISNNTIKENEIRFFLGYSGWEANQLNEEIKSNSWVVSKNIYEKNLIGKNHESLWKEKMVEFGGEYSIWSNAPEDPNLN